MRERAARARARRMVWPIVVYRWAVLVLEVETWMGRAAAHRLRVDAWVGPHLSRRRQGVPNPVEDFLFTYYSHRPAALRQWHPGYGVALAQAPDYLTLRGYESVPRDSAPGSTTARVSAVHLAAQQELVEQTRALLLATASRAPHLGCFGLHEWAMVYRAADRRHPTPLRLGNDKMYKMLGI